jgi:hypothetical protein
VVRFLPNEAAQIEAGTQTFSTMQKSVQTPKLTFETKFASPLNHRLEEMKSNLHNLMFNSGMSDKLVTEIKEGHVRINPLR